MVEGMSYVREGSKTSLGLYVGTSPIGYVWLFTDTFEVPEALMFQGITKTLSAFLVSRLGNVVIPRVNDLFIPEIKRRAKKLGKSIIYADPLPRQRAILLKYYDFQTVTEFIKVHPGTFTDDSSILLYEIS